MTILARLLLLAIGLAACAVVWWLWRDDDRPTDAAGGDGKTTCQ